MNENTKKVIADLKKAGLDTSNLEHQLQVDPLLDRQTDRILGDGILRQSEYSRYMDKAISDKKLLENRIQELATLHDANSTTSLPQEALDTISKLETALLDTGLFDEQSIKDVSFIGKKPLIELTKKPEQQNNNNVNNNNQQPNPKVEEDDMKVDLSEYVKANDVRTSMANLAYGTLATNLEIQAAIEEVKALGIPVTRAKVKELQENLRTGFDSGLDLDGVLEKTFKISEAQTKANEANIEKRIAEESDRKTAEALKAAGIQPDPRRKFSYGRHAILDRKSNNQGNHVQVNGNNQADKKPADQQNLNNKENPTNKYGDVEVFRNRRTREERMQHALELNDKVMEHYSNDPTYVD